MDWSTGPQPFTFAALDDGLNIAFLSQWDLGEVLACLNDYSRVQLTINVPGSKTGQKLYSDLRKKLAQAGFTPHIKREGDLQWSETKAEDCFRAFQSKLFPRRTLEGRIQRSLILHHGDMTDSSSLIRIIQDVQPDELYNLAAQSHVAVSFEEPEYTADSDALGALRRDAAHAPHHLLASFGRGEIDEQLRGIRVAGLGA